MLDLISMTVESTHKFPRGQILRMEVAGQGIGGPTPVNSPVYPHLVSTTSLASYTVDGWKSIGSRGVRLAETSQWLIESAHFATLVMKV